MKRKRLFKYDVILEEEDLCDREPEKKRLISIINRQGRVVIYSLRRMGKTSLVNVVSKKIKKEDSKAFHLYVDLNEVLTMTDVASRFKSHYEIALNEHFPAQHAKSYLNSLLSKIKLRFSGGIDLTFQQYISKEPQEYLLSLFQELKEISASNNLIIIIDEFQGISELKDVQAILRRELKKMSNSTIVLMGSNQRLLYKMFNDKKSPFFGFGDDIELKPIPIDEYLPYMNERFGEADIVISKEIANYMVEQLNFIPNYINELGAWMVDAMNNLNLTKGHIDEAINALTFSKSGRYESVLYAYTHNQRAFIKAVAILGRVKNPTGNNMKELTGFSATELSRVSKSLEDAPLLSKDTANQIFIIDPFLRKFLIING